MAVIVPLPTRARTGSSLLLFMLCFVHGCNFIYSLYIFIALVLLTTWHSIKKGIWSVKVFLVSPFCVLTSLHQDHRWPWLTQIQLEVGQWSAVCSCEYNIVYSCNVYSFSSALCQFWSYFVLFLLLFMLTYGDEAHLMYETVSHYSQSLCFGDWAKLVNNCRKLDQSSQRKRS